MGIIRKMRKADAVYWEPSGVDEYGKEQFLLPVNTRCRWEDELEQGIDEAGNETVYTSTVYVDRDMKVGGQIWLGKVADLPGPHPPADSKRIRRFDRIPKLSYKEIL